MQPLSFAARSLRRELRHGELMTLVAALVLAVASLAAVSTLATRVEQSLLASTAELVGGDAAIGSRQPLDPAWMQSADRHGLRGNLLVEFPTVVFAGEHNAFSDIRASDDAFPLRGQLQVREADGGVHVRHTPPSGQAYLDHRALVALQVPVGGQVQIGGQPLQVAGEIVDMPDSGDLIQMAPRVLMNLADARASGMLGPGSRVQYRLVLAGETDAVDRYVRWARTQLDDGIELSTMAETQQTLGNAFARGESFLRLAALMAALLSGIAVVLAAQRFARRKTDEVALLRCLGASHGEILATLLLQLLMMAVPACLLGLLLGWAMQESAFLLARELLDGARSAMVYGPGWMAFGIGLVVLVGFSLPPLLRLRDVPPIRVFGRDPPSGVRRLDLLYLLPLLAAAALVWQQSSSARMAAVLCLALGLVAILSAIVAWLLLFAVKHGSRRLSGAARFGVANLARRRTLTIVQTCALALSLAALNLLAVVGPSLLDRWNDELPPDTPNWFVLNVQSDQATAFAAQLDAIGANNVNALPMAVGKIVAIGGRNAPTGAQQNQRSNWMNREVRLSWSADLPPANRIARGEWFDTHGAPAEPQLSLDRGWAERFDLGIGDVVSVLVGERRIDATITSLREVDWNSFQANFFLMLDPEAGSTLAHSHLASFHLPAASSGELAGVTRAFPNVSLIDVGTILERVREIIGKVSVAAGWVLAFSLAAGVLVLLAALTVTADQRRFESALLRTIGAHRRQLLGATLAEFTALGLLAGGVAASGAAVTGWALARWVFELDGWRVPLLPLLGVSIMAVILVTLSGLAGTWRVAHAPPLLVLRRSA